MDKLRADYRDLKLPTSVDDMVIGKIKLEDLKAAVENKTATLFQYVLYKISLDYKEIANIDNPHEKLVEFAKFIRIMKLAADFGKTVTLNKAKENRELAEIYFDGEDLNDFYKYFPFIYDLWFKEDGIDTSKYMIPAKANSEIDKDKVLSKNNSNVLENGNILK
jgi:hypothetical protein